jgi:hypothetical protein
MVLRVFFSDFIASVHVISFLLVVAFWGEYIVDDLYVRLAAATTISLLLIQLSLLVQLLA